MGAPTLRVRSLLHGGQPPSAADDRDGRRFVVDFVNDPVIALPNPIFLGRSRKPFDAGGPGVVAQCGDTIDDALPIS